MIKRITVLFFIFIVFNSCTKDDICSGETPTTPLLIITFKNINNQNFPKVVNSLSVSTVVNDENIYIYKFTTTDSIAIPLRTGFDFTDYLFIKDDQEEAPGNIDDLTFTYNREDVYINRACAFKAIFNNIDDKLENEGVENWIKEITINKTTVENENETHVTIFH